MAPPKGMWDGNPCAELADKSLVIFLNTEFTCTVLIILLIIRSVLYNMERRLRKIVKKSLKI